MEFTNILHCNIQLMSTVINFCFDRNSTTPLEHKFGQARVRAHDKHTLTKFLRTLSILQAVDTGNKLAELDQFQQDLQIRGRNNSFGVTIKNQNNDDIYSVYDNDEYLPSKIIKNTLQSHSQKQCYQLPDSMLNIHQWLTQIQL